MTTLTSGRLRNTTDIPTAMIREVLAFVRPSGIKGFDVRVGGCRGQVKGRAYWDGSAYHDTARPFVNLYVGADSMFPVPPRQRTRAGYLPTPYLTSRIEALVYIAAHELRHLWQALVPRGRRVWGSRGQFSERDADAYAIRMLRAWRQR